jgi:suppressor of fused protein SUFU
MSASVTRKRVREHIRKTLGPISREWEERADGSALPFAIAQVDEQPASRAVTFVTMGLSESDLRFPSGKPTRQELLFSCYGADVEKNIQGLLAGLAMERVSKQRAFARGDVEGPAGPLFPSTRFEALYASLPAYFSDTFANNSATVPPTHFMWLVPITPGEAEFVNREGWSAFEDLLVKQDPDLLDLRRAEIKLPPVRLAK